MDRKGAKIRVTGYKGEWAGEVETMDATFEVIEGSYVAEAVDVTELMGTDDTNRDQKDWDATGLHPHGNTTDDGGSRTGFRLLGNLLYKTIITRGIDFGDDTDEKTNHQTKDDGDGFVITAKEELTEEKYTNNNDGTGGVRTIF